MYSRSIPTPNVRKSFRGFHSGVVQRVGLSGPDYTRFMHLSVARLCLDCHEIHEYDHCPACTSEAFAYITRWITLDNVASRPPIEHKNGPTGEKVETYRQILQPTASGSRTVNWLRNGSLLLAAGYLARWGWHIAGRHANESNGETHKPASP